MGFHMAVVYGKSLQEGDWMSLIAPSSEATRTFRLVQFLNQWHDNRQTYDICESATWQYLTD